MTYLSDHIVNDMFMTELFHHSRESRMVLKMKMIMMMRKVAVQTMNRKRLLVQWTRHSGRKYKPFLVRLWLTWKKRFVYCRLHVMIIAVNFEMLNRQALDLVTDYLAQHGDLSLQGSTSEDDLDDEAMMKLDDALAAVFKTQLQAKKDKNKKKGEILQSCFSVVFLHGKHVHLRV